MQKALSLNLETLISQIIARILPKSTSKNTKIDFKSVIDQFLKTYAKDSQQTKSSSDQNVNEKELIDYIQKVLDIKSDTNKEPKVSKRADYKNYIVNPNDLLISLANLDVKTNNTQKQPNKDLQSSLESALNKPLDAKTKNLQNSLSGNFKKTHSVSPIYLGSTDTNSNDPQASSLAHFDIKKTISLSAVSLNKTTLPDKQVIFENQNSNQKTQNLSQPNIKNSNVDTIANTNNDALQKSKNSNNNILFQTLQNNNAKDDIQMISFQESNPAVLSSNKSDNTSKKTLQYSKDIKSQTLSFDESNKSTTPNKELTPPKLNTSDVLSNLVSNKETSNAHNSSEQQVTNPNVDEKNIQNTIANEKNVTSLLSQKIDPQKLQFSQFFETPQKQFVKLGASTQELGTQNQIQTDMQLQTNGNLSAQDTKIQSQNNMQSLHSATTSIVEKLLELKNLTPPLIKSLKIQLNPPSLGQVNLKVSIDQNKMLSATINVSNQEIFNLLNNNLDTLKTAIMQQGINVSQISVNSLNSSQQNFSQGQNSQSQQSLFQSNQNFNQGSYSQNSFNQSSKERQDNNYTYREGARQIKNIKKRSFALLDISI